MYNMSVFSSMVCTKKLVGDINGLNPEFQAFGKLWVQGSVVCGHETNHFTS